MKICIRCSNPFTPIKHSHRICTSCRKTPLVPKPNLNAIKAREFVNSLKNAPCKDCGGVFHYTVMEYDHLPGHKKVASVSKMVASGKPISLINNEIDKCDLVCANCHRLRTFFRKHPEQKS